MCESVHNPMYDMCMKDSYETIVLSYSLNNPNIYISDGFLRSATKSEEKLQRAK